MGSWIAPRISATGPAVTLFDVAPAALERAGRSFASHPSAPTLTQDLRQAVAEADLIIETVVEDAAVKEKLFAELARHAAASAVFTSNTSILVPAQFLGAFPHKRRFCCLHFYQPGTAVDVMPIPETDPEIVGRLAAFAESIGEKPIVMKRVHPGYLFSAMGGALTDMAIHLAASGVADVETIDASWKAITGMALGPFGMLDLIGLDTSLKIRKERLRANPGDQKLVEGIALLEPYVNQGHLGRRSGHGFYKY